MWEELAPCREENILLLKIVYFSIQFFCLGGKFSVFGCGEGRLRGVPSMAPTFNFPFCPAFLQKEEKAGTSSSRMPSPATTRAQAPTYGGLVEPGTVIHPREAAYLQTEQSLPH